MFLNRPFSHPCIDSRADNTGSSLYFQYTFHSVLHSIIRDRYLPSNGFLFSPPPPRSRMSRVSGPSFPSYPYVLKNPSQYGSIDILSRRIGLLTIFFRSIAVSGWMHGSRNAKPRKTDSYIHRCTSLSTDGECLVDLARQTHTYIQKSKHKLNSSRLNFM